MEPAGAGRVIENVPRSVDHSVVRAKLIEERHLTLEFLRKIEIVGIKKGDEFTPRGVYRLVEPA